MGASRRRWFVAALGLVAVLGLLGVRKYVRHRARIPLLSMDAPTLAAARSVRVSIYSAEWCHSCRDTEAFLRENGIPFDVHDIENDPRAAARADALSPQHSIPVLDIDGAILVGYQPRAIEGALAEAARRRVGGGANRSN
ncbi:MAG TPA: glutaredoxin family protein [Polyangiaceae bacterium]|jgi:glutaredoxin